MSKEQAYYVPHGTYWPIIGSIGIATLFVGFANQMHGVEWVQPRTLMSFLLLRVA
jgi:cytochrome c oxidase subunit 3